MLIECSLHLKANFVIWKVHVVKFVLSEILSLLDDVGPFVSG
jgi:hypothetical protein